jgi:hypothetical protein
VHLDVLGRGVEGFLDRMVGMDLLREMAEFFQAFGPLFAGFRERAENVQALLKSPKTTFALVTARARNTSPKPCSSRGISSRAGTISARSW